MDDNDISYAIESDDLIEADAEDIGKSKEATECHSKIKRKKCNQNEPEAKKRHISDTNDEISCEDDENIIENLKREKLGTKDTSNGNDFLQSFCDENDLSEDTEHFNDDAARQAAASEASIKGQQHQDILLKLHNDSYAKKQKDTKTSIEDEENDILNINADSDENDTTIDAKDQHQELYLILNEIKDGQESNRKSDKADTSYKNIDINYVEEEHDAEDDADIEYISIDGGCILEEIEQDDQEQQSSNTKFSTFKTISADKILNFTSVDDDDDDNENGDDDDDDDNADQSSARSTESSIIMHQNNDEYIVSDYNLHDGNNVKSLDLVARRKAMESKNKLVAISNKSSPQLSICNLCGNQFANRYQLTAHMRVHMQEKSHECE